jgi:hypothetical protein
MKHTPTDAEFDQLVAEAILRHDEAVKAGKVDKADYKGDPKTGHLKGRLGEWALEKEWGLLHEHRYNDFTGGRSDIGSKTEVRCGFPVIRKDAHDLDAAKRGMNMVFVRTSKYLNYRTPFEQAIKDWRGVELEPTGWVNMRETMSSKKNYGTGPDPTRPACWTIPPEDQKPMNELEEI